MLGVLQEIHHLHHLFFGASQSGHVFEGHVVLLSGVILFDVRATHAKESAEATAITVTTHLAACDRAHNPEEEYQHQQRSKEHKYLLPRIAAVLNLVAYVLAGLLLHPCQLVVKVLVSAYVVGIVALYALLTGQCTSTQVAVCDGIALHSVGLDAHFGHLLVHHRDALVVMTFQYRLQLIPCDGLFGRTVAAATEEEESYDDE